MKELKLENSCKVALVDDKHYNRILLYGPWYLNGRGYVQANIGRATIMLSRFILNYEGRFDVDHKNTNPLDNREENFRLLSQSDNCALRRYKHDSNRTGYKSVKSYGKYKIQGFIAQMKFKNKTINSKDSSKALSSSSLN